MILNKHKSFFRRKNIELVAFNNPESIISEQFRMIHTNIRFSVDNQDRGIYLITSPSLGEGKSTAAANLAVSMTQQKKKVLLIDANLRNPSVHNIFKISNKDGLVDVLKGINRLDDTVHHTEIGRLDILTTGKITINPAELLGSKNMEELLKAAIKKYDIVLIDSNSVTDLTDAKLLAPQCDGVVLVLQSGRTSFEKAAEAKKELEFAKAKIVGAIFNED